MFTTKFVDHMSNFVRVIQLVLSHCYASLSMAIFIIMNNRRKWIKDIFSGKGLCLFGHIDSFETRVTSNGLMNRFLSIPDLILPLYK